METRELYNHIFNVTVYLTTDVCFEKEAVSSFKALKKGLKSGAISLQRITDLDHLKSIKEASEMDASLFAQEYNYLLKEVVSERLNNDCSFDIDKYGAYYVLHDGEEYLCGDSNGLFALYNYEALIEYEFSNE